jgi:hypothetical protein
VRPTASRLEHGRPESCSSRAAGTAEYEDEYDDDDEWDVRRIVIVLVLVIVVGRLRD